MLHRRRLSDPLRVIGLPVWQIMLVLVGLPACYLVNSLLPWSVGLFEQRDHAFFFPFWISVTVLHWSSVALVVALIRRAGGRLGDIGFVPSPLNVAVTIAVPVVVGVTLIVWRAASGASQATAASAQVPDDTTERVFWIFMSFTAGFSEELVYRGFLIRVLQARALRTWQAVGVATVAFFLMHGPAIVFGGLTIALTAFIMLCGFGVVFSILFLWRRSLVPGMCVHALIDVANVG